MPENPQLMGREGPQKKKEDYGPLRQERRRRKRDSTKGGKYFKKRWDRVKKKFRERFPLKKKPFAKGGEKTPQGLKIWNHTHDLPKLKGEATSGPRQHWSNKWS